MPRATGLILTTAALPMLAVAVVILFVGCLAVAHDRSSRVTLSFALMTLCASLWLAATSVMMMSTSSEVATGWARVTYVGVCALPAAVLQFAMALTEQWSRRLLIAAWSASSVFVILFTGTDLFITGVWSYPWGYYTRLSPLATAFLFFFGCALVAGLVALRRALHAGASQQQRRRAAAFLLALGVGYVATVDFLPSFGVEIYPMGYVAVLGFVVISVMAIRRYHLVDLNPSFIADHLLDTIDGGVIVVDTRGTIRVANPAAERLLGTKARHLAGRDLRTVFHSERLPATDSETFTGLGRTLNRRTTLKRSDGSDLELSISATMLRDYERLPVGILYVMHDLAEKQRAEQNEFAANHDALTGLPNRVYFSNRFEQTSGEIVAAGRLPGVLFLDLDGFKEINDRHGHSAGDRLLEIVATRLRNALREEDVVARYGGDEFIVLVSLRSAEDAGIVARKLEHVVGEPVSLGHVTLQLGTSVGAAVVSRTTADLDELIRAADDAMYRQKRLRRPLVRNRSLPIATAAAELRV